jgi:hypothetical protein
VGHDDVALDDAESDEAQGTVRQRRCAELAPGRVGEHHLEEPPHADEGGKCINEAAAPRVHPLRPAIACDQMRSVAG